jgi:hypothetical protein
MSDLHPRADMCSAIAESALGQKRTLIGMIGMSTEAKTVDSLIRPNYHLACSLRQIFGLAPNGQ